MGNCCKCLTDIPHLESIANYCKTGIIDNDEGKTLFKAKRARKFINFSDTIAVWDLVAPPGVREMLCPICEVNMMKLTVRKEETKGDGTWEIAHILSHHNGGEETLNNLRPTCKACNRAMGKMHMVDYIRKKVPPYRIESTLQRLKLTNA